MKILAFIILMFMSSLSWGLEIETPAYCVVHLRITTHVFAMYEEQKSKEEAIGTFKEIQKQGRASPHAVNYAIEIIELIYGVQPQTNEEYKAVYETVVSRCIYEQRQIDSESSV